MEPLFLALYEVLEIHAQQIELYGGPEGVRDPAGLESAVATPMGTFGGQFLHTSIPSMAAAYLFHICQNHPFVDGNKRAGANAAITFLLINDWELDFSEDELVDLVLAVASSNMSKSAVTEFFGTRCHPRQNPSQVSPTSTPVPIRAEARVSGRR